MDIFFTTLSRIAVLFTFIAIGFILAKCKVVNADAATVLSKLENNVFVPGLVLGTFVSNFTVNTFKTEANLLLISFAMILIIIPFSILVSKLITRDKFTQNIFIYGLAFSNFGFMGNAVVSAIFADVFFEYIIFTLPLWSMIYLWGVPTLLIPDSGHTKTIKSRVKSFFNPMFVAMIIGAVIGIFGIKIPSFLNEVINVSGSCMSPVAMILTGITVSKMNIKKTFTDIEIYVVSIIRLIIIPLVFLVIAQFIKFDQITFICALCALAMPLGLNTIVIPSAYGKDISKATGMTVISHLLSAITIPIIFLIVS